MRYTELARLMSELTLSTGYPVPAPRGFASQWSRGLGLERRGTGRLLFTGALYQLVPYIEPLVDLLRALERSDESAALALGLARTASKVLDLSALPLLRPDRALLGWSTGVLRSIVSLLARSGVEFDYMPEVSDMYSGALLRDMGMKRTFKAHAERVLKAIESTGASEIITVDPHTTETLAAGYREALGVELRVRSYLELVSTSAVKGAGNLEVTVHDSCIYARRLGLSGRVRELLGAAKASIREPPRSGAWTYCCGGPVEALLPSLAQGIARTRARELASTASMAVTACPICYVNLRRGSEGLGLRLVDLAEVIAGGG